ncbi:MAG: class I SAM-dependent methyltransferase [Albidovulum sp.]|nr:class I SAM-dependent methyltransferase [Albidovulum sp.]
MNLPQCRHCRSELKHVFLDLGYSPPSNGYISLADLNSPELTYPLRLRVCENCLLVQTEDFIESKLLFSPEYAYYSSTSKTWLYHAEQYCQMAANRFSLGSGSFVIEVASNDGYLLKNFVAMGIPCLGIEPAAGTAKVAEDRGIPVLQEFFGEGLGQRLAKENRKADLIIGNNVYAHVPDINGFTRGLSTALKPEGTITLEFPHLKCLVEHCQFDTVYHEHFSYLSLICVQRILKMQGLRIYDVEELATHGGSLRIFCCHIGSSRPTTAAVQKVLDSELTSGMAGIAYYKGFQARADSVKHGLLEFLYSAKREGKKVVGYGAAAKGNTLLNYSGIKPDLLPFVCDAAPSKQGKLLPGSHIPVVKPSALTECPPDFVLVLPWNLAEEIKSQYSFLSDRGTRFVTAVPKMKIS